MDQPEPETPNPEPQSAERSTTGAWRIIVVLLGLSAALGVVVFKNLIDSERHLSAVWHDLGEQGVELDVEGCVDAVLAWNDDCEAMKGLCDLSVTGMMVRCLEGQDRRPYCESQSERLHDTRFGVMECQARQLDSRHERSVCAASYRAVDGHCRMISNGEAL